MQPCERIMIYVLGFVAIMNVANVGLLTFLTSRRIRVDRERHRRNSVGRQLSGSFAREREKVGSTSSGPLDSSPPKSKGR
jgi:hypothetical protein